MDFALRFVGLNLGWAVCVLGAAWGWPFVGPIAVLAMAAVALNASHDYVADATLATVSLLIGGATDTLVIAIGWLTFPEQARYGSPDPFWMLALWFQFGLHLRVLMRFAIGKTWLAFGLGAVFGPVACWSAMQLGAVELPGGALGLAGLALQYGLVVAVLERLAHRVDGITARQLENALSSSGETG